jgi:hypothetical protein
MVSPGLPPADCARRRLMIVLQKPRYLIEPFLALFVGLHLPSAARIQVSGLTLPILGQLLQDASSRLRILISSSLDCSGHVEIELTPDCACATRGGVPT